MPSPAISVDETATTQAQPATARSGRESDRSKSQAKQVLIEDLSSSPSFKDREREGSWNNLEHLVAAVDGRESTLNDGGRSEGAYASRRNSASTTAAAYSSQQGGGGNSRRSGSGYDVSQSLPVERRKKRTRNCALALSDMILRNPFFSLLLWVLTVFALLGDDVRLMFFESDADFYFNSLTSFSLAIFTIEIVLSSLVKEDYFLGFWFIADVFATASLIFDLTPVAEAMMGYPEISVDNLSDNSGAGAVEGTEYARASRSARVGTRVARLLRVVRMVRVSKVLKCFRCILEGIGCAKPIDRTLSAPGEGVDIGEAQAESRVGKRLSERTTQRLIMLVLAMLLVVPQLNPGDYFAMMSNSAQYGANAIFNAWQDYELIAQRANTTAPALKRKRWDWEMQVLTYVYYHNWYASCPPGATGDCASSWLYKLCWIGYVDTGIASRAEDNIDVTKQGYIKAVSSAGQDWDALFTNKQTDGASLMKYMVGSLPEDIKGALASPWAEDCSESRSHIRGVSLLRGMPCPRSTLRKQETIWFTPLVREKDFFDKYMEGQFVFVFDVRELLEWEAILNIVQTIFVVIVLAIGALLFSRDVDQLVLLPIERMISKVEIIRQDPLYAIRLGDLQYKHETSDARASQTTPVAAPVATKKSKGKNKLAKKQATLETKILENAIIKLGSLLALGFGEAGSEIIGQNLDDDNATVNAMIPGSKVDAVYGFCDIRNFTTTTEVLQEKTMVFVNQVAEIVHRIVDEHLGAANKNVGEAFLLVWRVERYSNYVRPKIADLAVMSFIQVVAELNRNRQLAQYRGHPALLARLPNFRVSLGFGLHLGWSIEGAIGSEFKIDASYVSPHVNVASRLEAATMDYGVTILMSEPLVRACNPRFSRHFRPVDHVKLQGSNSPTRLFTVDLHYESLAVESAISERRRRIHNRFQERQMREQAKMDVLSDGYQVHRLMETDKDVRRMREHFTADFFQEFEKGYLNYEAGEWDVAERVLTVTRDMLPSVEGDGPSSHLLEFMRQSKFKAPPNWPGWRELRDK